MPRTIAVAAVALLAFFCTALAQHYPNNVVQFERCRFYEGGTHYTQWMEEGKYYGARLVSRDPRWSLGDLGYHATSSATCPTCAADQISAAVLWLGAGDPSRRDLERRVAPESVAKAMWPFPFQVSGADFRATTNIVTVTMDELQGVARAIRIHDPNKRFKDLDGRYHVIALAVARDCLSLFGILLAKDAAEVPIDRVAAFSSVLAVDWYAAAPPPPRGPSVTPKSEPGEELLLGDARRRAEEQRR